MNHGVVIFLGVLVSLAASFWTLLFAPQLQLGRLDTRVLDPGSPAYPAPRPGLAQQGAHIFVSQGCAECHTRQVRQTGVEFSLYLTDPGTNQPALAATLTRLLPGLDAAAASQLVAATPSRVTTGLTAKAAQKLAAQLTNGAAVATPVLVPLGPDIARGWGKRLSVAQDYLQDLPVQLGSLRLGPDLANYGARQTNEGIILTHLYEPRRLMPGSMMPPYRYLFEQRPLGAGTPAPADSLFVTGEGAKRTAIIPTGEARALAAYLVSLKAEASLFEAPTPKIPAAATPATNSVAAVTAP
ncbi:MAG: Cbb3-type cytochrome oxidase, cytochrome c subunit [Verrucomicrobiota bacterium]